MRASAVFGGAATLVDSSILFEVLAPESEGVPRPEDRLVQRRRNLGSVTRDALCIAALVPTFAAAQEGTLEFGTGCSATGGEMPTVGDATVV